MGHRVRFAEKVCIVVYNHSTGLTVITGLSLSPVQSRSLSSPWSSAFCCRYTRCGGLFLPCVCSAILSRAYVAYGDPVVVLLCWVIVFLL